MTFAETRDFLVAIVGVYPNFKVMDGTPKAWAERLKDCPPEKAMELLDKWIESDDSKYAPQLDYFVKGQKEKKLVNASWSNKPLIFHVGTGLLKGTLLDQEQREYGSRTALGDYRAGAEPYEIYDSNGERIQWMDERGYIHNGRGVFFKA